MTKDEFITRIEDKADKYVRNVFGDALDEASPESVNYTYSDFIEGALIAYEMLNE